MSFGWGLKRALSWLITSRIKLAVFKTVSDHAITQRDNVIICWKWYYLTLIVEIATICVLQWFKVLRVFMILTIAASIWWRRCKRRAASSWPASSLTAVLFIRGMNTLINLFSYLGLIINLWSSANSLVWGLQNIVWLTVISNLLCWHTSSSNLPFQKDCDFWMSKWQKVVIQINLDNFGKVEDFLVGYNFLVVKY